MSEQSVGGKSHCATDSKHYWDVGSNFVFPKVKLRWGISRLNINLVNTENCTADDDTGYSDAMVKVESGAVHEVVTNCHVKWV